MTQASRCTAKAFSALLLTIISAGCARWRPETNNPIKLTQACQLKSAPAVQDYGTAGVYAMYQFVIQGASRKEMDFFHMRTKSRGLAVGTLIVNLNGKDTIFARGPGVMRDQAQVDQEFDIVCGTGTERVYLTHVAYSPFDPLDPNPTSVRVR